MFRIIKWLIALPIGIFIFFNAYVYGNIITYRAVAPSKTAFMSMRMSQFASEGRDVELDYRWVPYDQISVNLKKALIASEDANFAEHSGFDWNGIKYAMKRNKQSGEVKAGGILPVKVLYKGEPLVKATVTASSDTLAEMDLESTHDHREPQGFSGKTDKNGVVNVITLIDGLWKIKVVNETDYSDKSVCQKDNTYATLIVPVGTKRAAARHAHHHQH